MRTPTTAKECEKWYASVPLDFRPKNVHVDGPVISYDFVEGQMPTQWTYTWKAARVALWGDDKLKGLSLHSDRYVGYVLEKLECLHFFDRKMKDKIQRLVAREIENDALTPAYNVHGDLTLSNVVTNGKDIVFIDPGDHRGLPCREIDEAKIMQSLDGWDVVRHGAPSPLAYPRFATRRVHWVLLITHYVRLLCHRHPDDAISFAVQRLEELVRTLV
jgi:hypothetical protein